MMSYCRFSDDNWKSDVYIYESERGFECHVASSKYVGQIPAIPPILATPPQEYMKALAEQSRVLKGLPTMPIGGEYDGGDFLFHDAVALLEFVQVLQAAGYHVPEWTIQHIHEDANHTVKGSD